MTPFMTGTTSSIAMQSLGKIVQRAPAVGAKCDVCFYRQDAAKRQTAGIVFTHRPKIRFFAPQGRLVAQIRVNLFRTDGHLGLLRCAKFHAYRCRGWECGQSNIKCSFKLNAYLICIATAMASIATPTMVTQRTFNTRLLIY